MVSSKCSELIQQYTQHKKSKIWYTTIVTEYTLDRICIIKDPDVIKCIEMLYKP